MTLFWDTILAVIAARLSGFPIWFWTLQMVFLTAVSTWSVTDRIWISVAFRWPSALRLASAVMFLVEK